MRNTGPITVTRLHPLFGAEVSGIDITRPLSAREFGPIRAAFEDRTIRRGIIIAEGDRIACQTWIEGTFTAPFTHSPVGKLEPNGARVVWDLMNMFRFDERGRLVEEFARTDNRSFLRQLGAEAA